MQCVNSAVWAENKLVRRKTFKEFVDEINDAMMALTPENKWGVGEFEWFGMCTMLQYNRGADGFKPESEMPDFSSLFTTAERGNSEGYIVRLVMRTGGGSNREPVAHTVLISGKCFDKEYAWKACRQLAEVCGII